MLKSMYLICIATVIRKNTTSNAFTDIFCWKILVFQVLLKLSLLKSLWFLRISKAPLIILLQTVIRFSRQKICDIKICHISTNKGMSSDRKFSSFAIVLIYFTFSFLVTNTTKKYQKISTSFCLSAPSLLKEWWCYVVRNSY